MNGNYAKMMRTYLENRVAARMAGSVSVEELSEDTYATMVVLLDQGDKIDQVLDAIGSLTAAIEDLTRQVERLIKSTAEQADELRVVKAQQHVPLSEVLIKTIFKDRKTVTLAISSILSFFSANLLSTSTAQETLGLSPAFSFMLVVMMLGSFTIITLILLQNITVRK